MKKIKNLGKVLVIIGLWANIGNVGFAIEEKIDSSEQVIQENANSILKENINKNIITPNISPGTMNDAEHTRRYFRFFEDTHRTKLKPNIDVPLIKKEKLTLPARIQQDAVTTHINKVEFSNSEIFTEEEISEFKSLLENKDATAEDINNFVEIINQQYRNREIITARANLESLEGGVLKIELMEAKIGKIFIEGNKFNRKWFLKKQISSKPSDVLNIQKLEDDLRTFNQNARSVKLSAKLKPGEEYGTTDIVLNAEEEFPFHFAASWDSFGRETTGLLRGGLMISSDSLFGFQDRLTSAVNIARSSVSPFVDYNVPINRKGTRVGASYMYGKSKITSGEYSDYDLNADTSVYSTYLTHPLINTQKTQLSLNTSANIKVSTADIAGFEYTNYKDYNLSVGLGGRYNFQNSLLFGSIYSVTGLIHDDLRSETNGFTKINAETYYVHYLPKNIIATFKAGGQYTPNDVPFVEQYQIGGMSSVRGYSESLLLGANSYYASLEMLFPIPFLPEEIKIPFKESAKYRLKDSIKFAVFLDNGAVFPHKTSTKSSNFLSSVGAGFRIAISKYLTARVYLGVPLMNTKHYDQSKVRLHFDLIGSPF